MNTVPHPLPFPGLAALAPFRSVCLAFLACLFVGSLQAAPVSVAGTYEAEGTAVQAAGGYTGPVSLRALLALDFDLAQGSLRHPDITAVEVEQEEWNLWIRTRNSAGAVEWSAGWQRNGGFEATKDGVKLLLRAKPGADDFFMFTLSPVNEGAALAIKVEQIEATKFGPTGKEVGTFLFLRRQP